MYIREIQPAAISPIENGKPLAGTWTKAFSELDLGAIQRPHSLHLPKVLKRLRIKEWQFFALQDEQFYLDASFCNFKFYCFAQVFLYDKKTTQKLRFRKVIPFDAWPLPNKLYSAAFDSRSNGFFFRVHNWLDADTIKIDLDIEASGVRPSFTAHLEYKIDAVHTTPMAVNLLFNEYRSMYAYKCISAIAGDIVFGGRHIAFDPSVSGGIFCDCKGLFPYPMQTEGCTGVGFDEQHKQYGFSMATSRTREPYLNNENVLWLNGVLTPLPPIKITMPHGIKADWIIQDMEGMIDLVFSPQFILRSGYTIIISRCEYEALYGHFNGTFVDRNGEIIQVRNLWGLGQKLFLRV
ncbi:hypothetical protein FACS1894200_09020 [Spirochaetia bacterium]|nr:hypothetical protein FACS1894200_09020 [Spirochaetia bacterium]